MSAGWKHISPLSQGNWSISGNMQPSLRETLGNAREAYFSASTRVIVTSLPLFQPCLTGKIKVEWTSTSLLGCGNISQTGKTSSGPTTGTILDLLIRTNSDKLWLDLVSSQVCKLFLFWMVEGSSCLGVLILWLKVGTHIHQESRSCVILKQIFRLFLRISPRQDKSH